MVVGDRDQMVYQSLVQDRDQNKNSGPSSDYMYRSNALRLKARDVNSYSVGSFMLTLHF